MLDVYENRFYWFVGRLLVLFDVYKKRSYWFVGKPLVLPDIYKKRFDWPPKEYVSLSEDSDVSPGYFFVTAASANHFGYVGEAKPLFNYKDLHKWMIMIRSGFGVV